MSIEFGFSVEKRGEVKPLVSQVHGAHLVEVAAPKSCEALKSSPPEADGLVTMESGLELYVFTADCLPILAFGNERTSPWGIAHCGWRGALAGIASALVEKTYRPSETLHVVFGPAILGCCFEVKEDFVAAFQKAGKNITPYLETRQGKTFCHLWRFIAEVEFAKFPKIKLHTKALRCTVCSAPELPSYRRNGNTDIRIRSWLRKSVSAADSLNPPRASV